MNKDRVRRSSRRLPGLWNRLIETASALDLANQPWNLNDQHSFPVNVRSARPIFFVPFVSIGARYHSISMGVSISTCVAAILAAIAFAFSTISAFGQANANYTLSFDDSLDQVIVPNRTLLALTDNTH